MTGLEPRETVEHVRSWLFAKGHGTLNDFVIVKDRQNLTPVTDADVRFLCNRRAGIGGDGLLRAVKASTIQEWRGNPDLWFMDYRNADGSIAEMCGNGLRVFVRFLIEEDLAPSDEVVVATRAGVRKAWPLADGRITTTMGEVTIGGDVTVSLGDRRWQASTVDVGNPHAVVMLDPTESLTELDLSKAPSWHPLEAFPHGANVEFVQVINERHIAMRVFERGAGETFSCGTGVVASAMVQARRAALEGGSVQVDVPGGILAVGLDGEVTLTGPAVVVARGEMNVPDQP